MRASQLFLPTLREAPADAEAVSHKLLVRGGFVRQVSAGLWSYLPLGWRVHRKVESEVLIDELFHEIDRWLADGMKRPKRLKMAKPAALAMAEASLIPLD